MDQWTDDSVRKEVDSITSEFSRLRDRFINVNRETFEIQLSNETYSMCLFDV